MPIPAGIASVCQLLFQVGLEFVLLVELLERASAGQDAVAELDRLLAPPVHEHLGGDDQQLPAEAPGAAERRGPLFRVLDDVDDVAEVDDVRFLPRARPAGKPGPSRRTRCLQPSAVRCLRRGRSRSRRTSRPSDEAVAQEALHRPREIPPPDRRFVTGDGRLSIPIPPVRLSAHPSWIENTVELFRSPAVQKIHAKGRGTLYTSSASCTIDREVWPRPINRLHDGVRMGVAAVQHSFSGHETFPFRYPWLKKGFDAVRQDGDVFLRDDAITTLGVGKNMVRSIRHWCLAAGVLEESREGSGLAAHATSALCCSPTTALTPTSKTRPPSGCCTGRSRPTAPGPRPGSGPSATSTSRSSPARRSLPRCIKWTQTLPGKQVAESSLKRDVEVFLRTYVPSRQSRGDLAEDSLDCPLVELGLIIQPGDGQTYQFRRAPAEPARRHPPLCGALHSGRRSLRRGDACPARPRTPARQPGRLFKIDESSLVERLEGIEQQTEGAVLRRDRRSAAALPPARSSIPNEVLAEAYATGGRRR